MKIEDVETMLTETEQEILACIIDKLDNINEYIVCNQDEPYAEKVWQAILSGEDAKGDPTPPTEGEIMKMENNSWIKMDDKEPEFGKLVLTWSLFGGLQLRSFNIEGVCFDEYGDLDDSELDFELWTPLPAPPTEER